MAAEPAEPVKSDTPADPLISRLRPVWPGLPLGVAPTLDETTAHNLAVVADRLGRIAETIENLTGVLERVSGHLYEIKSGRAVMRVVAGT